MAIFSFSLINEFVVLFSELKKPRSTPWSNNITTPSPIEGLHASMGFFSTDKRPARS
jgi:hypothetical protein